jgi:hypothetical protein
MANVSKKQKQNQNRAKIKCAERVLKMKMKINVRGGIGQNGRAASDSGRVPVFALISCRVSE